VFDRQRVWQCVKRLHALKHGCHLTDCIAIPQRPPYKVDSRASAFWLQPLTRSRRLHLGRKFHASGSSHKCHNVAENFWLAGHQCIYMPTSPNFGLRNAKYCNIRDSIYIDIGLKFIDFDFQKKIC